MKILSLSALILLPLISSVMLFLPFFNTVRKIRCFAQISASIHFIYMLLFLAMYNPFSPESALREVYRWIEPLGISFSLSLDGISLICAVLTSFVFLMAIVASKHHIKEHQRFYYSMVFLLQAAVLGVFFAHDMFLFFMFWELELVPMYFLISIWGSGKKEASAMKFLLYTFGGSIFMLMSILGLYYCHYVQTGMLTMDMDYIGLYNDYPEIVKYLAFVGFFVAFGVKLPVVPLHSWLPSAHVDASAPVSMMLAGVLLKLGGYGLIRVNLFFFPDIFVKFSFAVFVLGIINIVYASCIAFVQSDIKRQVAYSSIAHMGIFLVGLGALNAVGMCGAVFQMVSHGLISAGLFMVIGMIYLRTHTRDISLLGGLGKVLPGIYYLTLVVVFASIGVPLLSGFPGEIMSFFGAFISGNEPVRHFVFAAMIGVILTPVYMLNMVRGVFGGVLLERFKKIERMHVHEAVVMISIVFAIVLIGVYPVSIMKIFAPMIENFFSI